ncbi:PREDICTED: granzyme A [Myotis davidii]|uniref:granzyme A n=1 Tax=Myotis davidii TaxID=225400 RepID=UPI0003EC34F5|nr:PREDICTED: granzyme A [Myotis davidii]
MRDSQAALASALSAATFLLLLPGGLCARIIGGTEVAAHSRPYMALIRGTNDSLCAGALIADAWVLTAAHCALNRSSQVILGAHSQSKQEPEKQIMSVKKQIPFPHYKKNRHEGDLQLLKLGRKATINRHVAILSLPKRGEDVKPGTKCRVAGWGMIHNSKLSASDTLREVWVTVLDRETCNGPKYYGHNPVIRRDMICAGDRRGGKDTCNGDSGSPLICEGTFRGVTSFGKPGKCGDPRGPGVYMLLSQKYLSWIRETTRRAA